MACASNGGTTLHSPADDGRIDDGGGVSSGGGMGVAIQPGALLCAAVPSRAWQLAEFRTAVSRPPPFQLGVHLACSSLWRDIGKPLTRYLQP